MKNIFSILIIAILVASCGGGEKNKDINALLGSEDIKAIRAKRAEIVAEQQTINTKLKQIDSVIAKLSPNQKIPLITTYKAKDTVFNHFLELQGNVQTKQNVLVYPEMPGTLLRIYVKEGQKVAKGQILGSIDDGGKSSQVAQMETQLALAKTTFERQKRLWEQKIGSEIQYLQAKATYESQENALKQLKSQLGKATLRAPFAGVVDDVIKEQGTVVAPGMGSEVFRIVNLNNMYVETDVPESYISSIKKGKNVAVEFPVLGVELNSKVRQAGNFINPANRTFKVEVGIPNKDKTIKPNLTAKLKINDYTNAKAILIPQSIISENAKGEQYVYVVNDINGNKGIAKQAVITTGKTQGNIVEVLSGLKAGDQIVNEGARSVQDGLKVEIRE